MLERLWCVALSGAMLLVLCPGSGQCQTAPLTMSEAVARVLDNHPELAAWEAQLAVHEATADQATLMPNPELELEMEEWGLSRSWLGREAEGTVRLSQSIPLGSRRALGAAYARSAKAATRAGRALARNDLIREARGRFVRAAMAQASVAIAEAGYALTVASGEAVARRIEAGALPPAEAARAEVELVQARVDLADARASADEARVRLVGTWGGRRDAPLSLAPLGPPDGPVNAAVDGRLWTAPDDARIAMARAEAKWAEAEAIPDLNLGVGWRESSGFEAHSLVLFVGLPLPLWNTQRGVVDAAHAQARKAQFERSAKARSHQSEVATVQVQLATALARLQLLTEELMPALEAAHQTVLDGFAQGRYGTLDLLASQERLLAAKREALLTKEACWMYRIDLDWLSGESTMERDQ